MTNEEKLAMSLGEVMFSQRAIRRFKPDPIPDEDLHAALEAATKAPSGSNLQPWALHRAPGPRVEGEVREALPRGLVGQAPGPRHLS